VDLLEHKGKSLFAGAGLKVLPARLAFSPASPRPTRETERMSIRLPCPSGRTRITTSSLNPNQPVVAVPSILPSAGSVAMRFRPSASAARIARANASAGTSSARISGAMSG